MQKRKGSDKGEVRSCLQCPLERQGDFQTVVVGYASVSRALFTNMQVETSQKVNG